MKRLIAFIVLFSILLSLSACQKYEKQIDRLFEGLKTYDRSIMSEVLTEFPDNSSYVYLDDIFNDEKYIKIYQALFSDIEYEIIKTNSRSATVKVKMPDIQKLYSDVSAWALSAALEDPELSNKLAENDYNGIVLIQELMYAYATNGNYEMQTLESEFNLYFERVNGKEYILCDDQLRALITGNFYLSKNIRSEADGFSSAE
jgi:hypothetical protein